MKNMVNTKWRFPTALIGLLLVIVLVLETCERSSASSVSTSTQTPAPNPQARVNAYEDCARSTGNFNLTADEFGKYIDDCAKVAGTAP